MENKPRKLFSTFEFLDKILFLQAIENSLENMENTLEIFTLYRGVIISWRLIR